ncbi:MAG: hypothetical protein HC853_04280 [Anaerolineae bacterium]|nr:hypothetical protein [Anaerolineae bacterium]
MRIVRLGGNLAVIQIGHDDGKAFDCQPVRQPPNVRLDAPPLLNQHNAWVNRALVRGIIGPHKKALRAVAEVDGLRVEDHLGYWLLVIGY